MDCSWNDGHYLAIIPVILFMTPEKGGAHMLDSKLVCYGGRQGDLDGGTWH